MEFTIRQKLIINLYNVVRMLGISEERSLNLDTSNVLVEKVPLVANQRLERKIKRIYMD
jgi:KUP system potassium uptake protein